SAVRVRLAVRIERRDPGRRLAGRLLMQVGWLVLAAAVEAAVLVLVPVLGSHLGERLEVDRGLALRRLVGAGALAQADRLDGGTAVLWLDGERYLGALLQLLRLEAVG